MQSYVELLASIVAERVGLARDPHAEVENAVALALYRRYEPVERSAENMVAPERLHVWGTRRGGEIAPPGPGRNP